MPIPRGKLGGTITLPSLALHAVLTFGHRHWWNPDLIQSFRSLSISIRIIGWTLNSGYSLLLVITWSIRYLLSRRVWVRCVTVAILRRLVQLSGTLLFHLCGTSGCAAVQSSYLSVCSSSVARFRFTVRGTSGCAAMQSTNIACVDPL